MRPVCKALTKLLARDLLFITNIVGFDSLLIILFLQSSKILNIVYKNRTALIKLFHNLLHIQFPGSAAGFDEFCFIKAAGTLQKITFLEKI